MQVWRANRFKQPPGLGKSMNGAATAFEEDNHQTNNQKNSSGASTSLHEHEQGSLLLSSDAPNQSAWMNAAALPLSSKQTKDVTYSIETGASRKDVAQQLGVAGHQSSGGGQADDDFKQPMDSKLCSNIPSSSSTSQEGDPNTARSPSPQHHKPVPVSIKVLDIPVQAGPSAMPASPSKHVREPQEQQQQPQHHHNLQQLPSSAVMTAHPRPHTQPSTSSLPRAQPTRPVVEKSLASNGLPVSLPLGLQELAALGCQRQQERAQQKELPSAAAQPGNILGHSDRSAFTALTVFLPRKAANAVSAGVSGSVNGSGSFHAPHAARHPVVLSQQQPKHASGLSTPATSEHCMSTATATGPVVPERAAHPSDLPGPSQPQPSQSHVPGPPQVPPPNLHIFSQNPAMYLPEPVIQLICALSSRPMFDPRAMPDLQNAPPGMAPVPPAKPSSAHRQAAVAKYLEKRKHRSFKKKVRYESRKRLAEARPRVRGQFVKQDQLAAMQKEEQLTELDAKRARLSSGDPDEEDDAEESDTSEDSVDEPNA